MIYLDNITGMSAPNLKALCRWLDVSEKTLHRWMTGATPVPRLICYALYHESKYGRSLGFTEAYNDRDALTAKIADLELKNRALAADVNALRSASAANDALYLPRDVAPPVPRSAPLAGFRIHRRMRC